MFKDWNNWPKNVPISFLLGILLFFLILSFALFTDSYYLLAISFIPLIFYFSLYHFETIYFFIVSVTPISVALEELLPETTFNLSLPSELLLALMLLINTFKLLSSNLFPKKLFSHPISIAVFIYLGWTLITTITSSMPLVSIKYFIAKLWFTFPLFFFPALLFKEKKNIYKFFLLYIIPFSFVILYTINRHLSYGLFDKQAAHLVMRPFYNDHTSYGAILAMYLPILVGLIIIFRKRILKKTFLLLLLSLFTLAIVLSYTRAAWISVLGAALLVIMLFLRIKLRTILILTSLSIGLLFFFRLEIIDKLDKNEQDSSAELSEHIQSISNIATDASNLERINRWSSALKMFSEKPFFGWGPGTYMFQYAPFQMADDKTIISTNFGDWGNAHSEYIGPLAEQGIPGLITVLLIVFLTLQTAFKLFYKLNDKHFKLLVLMIILSLTTYFIHGLLNNFLDTDKASVPFWGMIAILVSIDIWKDKKESSE